MTSLSLADKAILQELAKQYAEIAALPIQAEKQKMWTRHNGLKPERPLVMVDQVCWNEMDNSDQSLSVIADDPFLRSLEGGLRRDLYQWKHFPVDRVFDPWINIYKASTNTGFGIEIDEKTISIGSVASHEYHNLFKTQEDLEQIQVPQISHDQAETQRRWDVAQELFDGIIDIRLGGASPYLSIWDPLSMWMSVEEAMLAMVDRPDYIHKILRRMTDGYLSMLDQLEDQGLLSGPQSTIHCTGAYSDELPAEGYDPAKPRCKDMWMFGMAQMLGAVSSAMYDEFEIEYTRRLCERFGLVYYGCCEPLDKKMDLVRKLPNVRKVSMSAWADHANGAAEIAGDYVFSSKPNPAHIGMGSFDGDLVRKELSTIKAECDKNHCPLEFIFKDISTVAHDPARLDQWAKIAMEVAGG